jgi:hypothetical protein
MNAGKENQKHCGATKRDKQQHKCYNCKKKKKTLKRSGTIESSNHEAGIEDIQFSIPNMRMKQNTR